MTTAIKIVDTAKLLPVNLQYLEHLTNDDDSIFYQCLVNLIRCEGESERASSILISVVDAAMTKNPAAEADTTATKCGSVFKLNRRLFASSGNRSSDEGPPVAYRMIVRPRILTTLKSGEQQQQQQRELPLDIYSFEPLPFLQQQQWLRYFQYETLQYLQGWQEEKVWHILVALEKKTVLNKEQENGGYLLSELLQTVEQQGEKRVLLLFSDTTTTVEQELKRILSSLLLKYKVYNVNDPLHFLAVCVQ